MATKRKADADLNSTNGSETASKKFKDSSSAADFGAGLFDDERLQANKSAYAQSKPYLHGVIHGLINDNLLRSVRQEILANISFTPKETDIYKIHQSGDLANLDGLDDVSLKRLPSLIRLRDAMYGREFREYLSDITGAGKLSGKKTDMAVNVYIPGCHLLCHDDVIGSRRVSYILYLTDPDIPWKKEWGGALRLFPTESVLRQTDKSNGNETIKGIKAPSHSHTLQIPPAFNQLSFFAVQPGESFHDVEEVYARPSDEPAEEDGGRVRMAISGWFHIPQEGEEGYVPGAEEKQAERSSLTQLQGKTADFDLPQPHWMSHADTISPEGTDETDLSEADLNFLIKYLNPQYLTPDAVEEMAERFANESFLQLGMFLSNTFAEKLKSKIETDEQSGTAAAQDWNISRPPHKHRYLFKQPGQKFVSNEALYDLVNDLFPSVAFKRWLALTTGLGLNECNILARRFRRGLDYTLATSYDDDDPRLEVNLGITPTDGWEEDDPEEIASDENSGSKNAPEGGVGGYEMYMAGDDDDDDENDSEHGVTIPSSHTGAGNRRGKADPAVYKAAGIDEDDGVLFAMPASWNVMSVVLRDKGTLKFTKYVSKSAKGDRWDISAEWKVDPSSDDEDEEVDG